MHLTSTSTWGEGTAMSWHTRSMPTWKKSTRTFLHERRVSPCRWERAICPPNALASSSALNQLATCTLGTSSSTAIQQEEQSSKALRAHSFLDGPTIARRGGTVVVYLSQRKPTLFRATNKGRGKVWGVPKDIHPFSRSVHENLAPACA